MTSREISRRSLLAGLGGISGIAAACPVLVSFDARAADSINLTLAWIPEGEVAFIYAAKKRGFWEKRGLNVTITRGFGSGESAKTVGLNRYEFGQTDIGVMIKALSSGLPLISIAMINQRSPVCIVSLKGSGITKPKDLEVKRLGGASAGVANTLWPAFAKVNGIETAKVKMVSLQPGLNIQALTNKDVDAIATVYQSSATYLMVDNVPYDIMFFAAHGLDIYSITFITQPDRIKNAPKQLSAFVEGAMEGLKFSYLNPEETLKDFVEAIPESGKSERDRQITRHSLMINTAEGLTDDVRRHGLGWHDEKKVRRTLDIANAYLNLTSLPDIKSVYTNEFVGNVKLSETEWNRTTELAKDYLFT
jgi:NitT/TauT family transport system substrate-binding protein